MLELRILRYFLTVAREENITRAAALLHVTQPTLSRQLMQLEDELGVKLFRRSQHRIVLTDEGMLLRRRAQEIVELAEKAEREFRHEEQLGGVISIGSGDLRSMEVLAEMFFSFRRDNPLVQFEIYSGNSDNIKERIEQGLLDLGLLLEPVDISKYEFIRMPVREQWGALVREDSALAGKDYVTPADLAALPLIMTGRELVRKEVLNWFGSYADRLEIAAAGNLPYNMCVMAEKGLGVFINLKLDSHHEGLRFIPFEPRLESGTVLAWKKAEIFSPTTAAFIAHVQKCLSSISDNPI